MIRPLLSTVFLCLLASPVAAMTIGDPIPNVEGPFATRAALEEACTKAVLRDDAKKPTGIEIEFIRECMNTYSKRLRNEEEGRAYEQRRQNQRDKVLVKTRNAVKESTKNSNARIWQNLELRKAQQGASKADRRKLLDSVRTRQRTNIRALENMTRDERKAMMDKQKMASDACRTLLGTARTTCLQQQRSTSK